MTITKTTNFGFPKPSYGDSGTTDWATYNADLDAADAALGAAISGNVYYIRADGSASLVNATGPDSDATKCMNVTMYNASVFSPGDTIYISDSGGDFSTPLLTPSAGVFPNLISHIAIGKPTWNCSVSLDGLWTFSNTATYSQASAWTLSAGEVYVKTCVEYPYQFFVDGVQLTPVVSTSVGQAQAISRGQFTYYNQQLYCRLSNGASPTLHATRMNDRRLDISDGAICCNQDYNYFTGLSVIYCCANKSGDALPATKITGCIGSTFDKFSVTLSRVGMLCDGVSKCTVSNANLYFNLQDGLSVEGDINGIDISGIFSSNGKLKLYTGVDYAYAGDGDNIGIGGLGGTMNNININNFTCSYSGPPSTDSTDTWGAGIFVGTTYPMTVTNLSISNGNIYGSHGRQLSLNNQVVSFSVRNVNIDKSDGTVLAALVSTNNAAFDTGFIENINFTNNNSNPTDGITLKIDNAGQTSGHFYLRKNLFSGNNSNWGELFFTAPVSTTYLTEADNTYKSSGTRGIVETGVGNWAPDHIVGGSAGYWQNDSGQGLGDVYLT